MRKTFLVFVMVLTIKAVVSASVISGPQISVTAQVVGAGTQKKTANNGESYNQAYIDLQILSVNIVEPSPLDYASCPVKKGRIYRVIDNYQSALELGDTIKAGIEFVSAMGADGPVEFLQWSPLAYEDARPVKARDGSIISYFQGSF